MAIAAGQPVDADDVVGRIATQTQSTNSASIGATETSVATVTASLVLGVTYKITLDIGYTVSAANLHFFGRIREDSTSGTTLQGRRFDAGSTAQTFGLRLEAQYTAVATGNKTFVATFERTDASGTVTRAASATSPTYFYVDRIS